MLQKNHLIVLPVKIIKNSHDFNIRVNVDKSFIEQCCKTNDPYVVSTCTSSY